MHTNPNMFKGLFLNDVIAEEIGEFEKFLEFYSATKDCLMSGNKRVGMMTAFGTGGNVNKGSKDFQRAWHEANELGFEKFLIPATRMFFYGGAKEPERRLPLDTTLYRTYKPYELIGVEDRVAAENWITTERKGLLSSGNQKAYNEDLQNNPLNEQEIFRKSCENSFNQNILNKQMHEINILVHPKFSRYKLEWVIDEKTKLPKIPYDVKCVPLKAHENQDECALIIDGELPSKAYSNKYNGGVDSYDQNSADASKSLGAMVVIDRITKMPVACIRCRPKKRESFYDFPLNLPYVA